MADEELYRRDEDRKWRERTEERIVGLTASDGVQNDRLDEHDEKFDQIEELVEGKPEDKDDNGLKGDLHDTIRRLNKLEAMMAPDHLGEGGIINRLKRLEKNAGFEEKQYENRWKFWIAVVGAIAVLGAALIPNLDRIEKFFEPRASVQPAPKKRKVVKVRRISPPDQDPTDESEE